MLVISTTEGRTASKMSAADWQSVESDVCWDAPPVEVAA
jgi:hypothetical protein